MAAARGTLWMGHAGFSSSEWRRGEFFPKGLRQDMEFSYYADRFNCSEQNTTFYGIPRESTFANWRTQAAGRAFQYALKIPKKVTHDDKLTTPDESWEVLYSRASALGGHGESNHLGPFLFQLPPSFVRNMAKLEHLATLLPPDRRFAFEFRHASWSCDEVNTFLRARNWALVVSSHPVYPLVEVDTGDFVYYRMHGIRELHKDLYTDAELAPFAERFKALLARGVDVYCFFQSEVGSQGLKNAATLKAMVLGAAAEKIKPPKGSIMGFFKPKPAAAAPAAAAAAAAAAPAPATAAAAPAPTSEPGTPDVSPSKRRRGHSDDEESEEEGRPGKKARIAVASDDE